MISAKKIDWSIYRANFCPKCDSDKSEYSESVVYDKKDRCKIIKRAFICTKCGEKWEAYIFGSLG